MAKRTCSTPGCANPSYARSMCTSCYAKAYRAKSLPPKQLEIPLPVHSLSNVRLDEKVGDCRICGPNVPIRPPRKDGRHGGAECRAKRRGRSGKVDRIRQKYGLAESDYRALVVKHAGRCGICGDLEQNLVVDHCHTTGRVRGLLCRICNLGLGYFRDDTERMMRAIAYLDA